MNIITHDRAYCLFPRATLEEQRAMSHLSPISPHDVFEAGTYRKYTERGYDLLHITPEDLDSIKGCFPIGNRFIGDEKCWTLPVLPARTELSASTLNINSFYFSAGPQMQPILDYRHFRLARLEQKYAIAPDEVELLQNHLQLVKRTDNHRVPYVCLSSIINVSLNAFHSDRNVDMQLRNMMIAFRASPSA
jgi:hypothetical protein